MRRPTLRLVFFLSILGLAGLLGILFGLLDWTSRETLLETSEAVREERTERIANQVVADVEKKVQSLRRLEGLLRAGAVGVDDPLSIEAILFAEVAGESEVSEATFTRATAAGDRWQVSVYRAIEGQAEPRLVTRFTHLDKGRFVSETRERPPGGAFQSAPLVRQEQRDVADPTAHDTFVAAANDGVPDRILASDLHWFEPDMPRPARERRVIVSGQKAVRDAQGRFAGVLRVGLLTRTLNELVRRPSTDDPHWVFFCDTRGRLLSAVGPGDTVEEQGNDLRVVAASLPPELRAALGQQKLRDVERDREHPQVAAFDVEGRRYLATFRYLRNSLDWVVAIVAPESAYLGGLTRLRMVLIPSSLLIIAIILLTGFLTLRYVRRGLGAIEASAARMRDFDFAAAPVRLSLQDLQDVGEGLELAKTAMRAMGRYVPVDLVRLLFKTGREPALGGELQDVSMLFTDIEGFTAISERLSPNDLARALGRYFETMTAAVHAHQGVIDKYIGDSIMAIWNAPTPCTEHSRRTCEAALACIGAGEALYAAPEWEGMPRLVTRFGIHRDAVMVGHFGAPDRMSYTVLGDGVNLASRLEGLNKQYGTRVLVSEAVHRETRALFEFRLVDRVAVKGKTRGIEVFELLGPAGTPVPAGVRAYERALAAYWARDFAAAAAALEGQPEDPPSRTLLERCRSFAKAPPPADWDGIWVATSK